MISQRANRLRETREVGHLEEGIACVCGKAAPQIWSQHGGDHGAIATARFSRDAAMLAPWHGAVVSIDPGDDFVAQIGVVATGGGRIHKLAPAEGGPAVYPDDDTGRSIAF